MAERVNKGVIKQTTDLYISDPSERDKVAKHYQEAVHREVETRIEEQRNDFVHANRPRWTKGITEEGLWEADLAAGLTIQKSLDEFGYPKYADEAESDMGELFVDYTQGVCNILGDILYDLEREIADQNAKS